MIGEMPIAFALQVVFRGCAPLKKSQVTVTFGYDPLRLSAPTTRSARGTRPAEKHGRRNSPKSPYGDDVRQFKFVCINLVSTGRIWRTRTRAYFASGRKGGGWLEFRFYK